MTASYLGIYIASLHFEGLHSYTAILEGESFFYVIQLYGLELR